MVPAGGGAGCGDFVCGRYTVAAGFGASGGAVSGDGTADSPVVPYGQRVSDVC